MTSSAARVAIDFDTLRRDLDGCLAEVLGVARTAATATTDAWSAIVEAMTGQSRATLPPAGTGANPAEVRDVLIGVRELFERRLVVVEDAMRHHGDEVGDEIEDAVWTFRHRRLESFVNDELEVYIKTMTPRPTVASVFAKAANVAHASAPASAMAAGRVQLHRCKTCGAPRLRDGLYGNCLYCGHPFFTGREEIE